MSPNLRHQRKRAVCICAASWLHVPFRVLKKVKFLEKFETNGGWSPSSTKKVRTDGGWSGIFSSSKFAVSLTSIMSWVEKKKYKMNENLGFKTRNFNLKVKLFEPAPHFRTAYKLTLYKKCSCHEFAIR